MKFQIEKRILHHIMLHSKDFPNSGLLFGKLGVALVLEKYARGGDYVSVRKLAESLVDDAFADLNEKTPTDMASGICGIGWGIEYLLQNKYMKGDSLCICEAIDDRLMHENPLLSNDLSIASGLEGCLHYILAHIQGTKGFGAPFSNQYLEVVKTKLDSVLESNVPISNNLRNLIDMYMSMYNSEEWSYSMKLTDLVSPDVKKGRILLGLHKGLAGYFLLNFVSK